MYCMGTTQPSPVPLISFQNNVACMMSTSTTAPTSLFALMSPNRRVLFPSTASEEKLPPPQSLFSTAVIRSNGCHSKKESMSDRNSNRHHPYPRAEYVRGADLKLASSSKSPSTNLSSSKKSRPKTANTSTTTDISQEKDLSWLYQQRADIDRRIAQLQEKAGATEKDVQGKKSGFALN